MLIFRSNKLPPKKILIYRVGSLGDNIVVLPVINNLICHYKDSSVDILVRGGNKLLSMENIIDLKRINKIINYDGLSYKHLVDSLKAEKYDLVIELSPSLASFYRLFRNMLFFRLVIGIKCGFGWEISTIKSFRKLQDKYLTFPREVERFQKLLQRQSIKPHNEEFILNKVEDEVSLLERYSVADRNNAAVVIGGKRPQNRWPVDNFIEVIEYLIGLNKNVIILGSDEDKKLLENKLSRHKVLNLCGMLSPLESAAVLSKCDFLLTNDTGPMHLAYAVNTPVIALFSARDFKGKWYPPENGVNKVLRDDDTSCRLCLSETCGNNICMQNISVDSVKKSIDEFISREQSIKAYT